MFRWRILLSTGLMAAQSKRIWPCCCHVHGRHQNYLLQLLSPLVLLLRNKYFPWDRKWPLDQWPEALIFTSRQATAVSVVWPNWPLCQLRSVGQLLGVIGRSKIMWCVWTDVKERYVLQKASFAVQLIRRKYKQLRKCGKEAKDNWNREPVIHKPLHEWSNHNNADYVENIFV